MSPNAIPGVLLAVIVIGYGLGAIPFGLLLTRAAGLGDIRAIGSGNIGATNVLRTGRKGLAAATLLLDAAKGAAAVVIGSFAIGTYGELFGGLAALAGHMWPLWLGFRGGKGVATGFGVLLAASPLVAVLTAIVWGATLWVTRISSASALAACAAAPLLAAVTTRPLEISALALVMAVLVILRHRANIARLFDGTEPRVGEGSGATPRTRAQPVSRPAGGFAVHERPLFERPSTVRPRVGGADTEPPGAQPPLKQIGTDAHGGGSA